MNRVSANTVLAMHLATSNLFQPKVAYLAYQLACSRGAVFG
jgi:hypothetical protein